MSVSCNSRHLSFTRRIPAAKFPRRNGRTRSVQTSKPVLTRMTILSIVFTQRLTTPFHIYKNVFIPNGVYNFVRHQFTYDSGRDRKFTYNIFECFGGYYRGTLNEFRLSANYRPTAKFSIS